jgi:threonine dehydratase
MATQPSLDDIRTASHRIARMVARTPLVRSTRGGGTVHLKLETEQHTGSFKVRGAANAILQLSAEERSAGVVAVSSGNHGRAVAHVADALGIEATICLSSRVPPMKVEAIERLGARVVIAGPDQDSADAEARRLVDTHGLTFIHPFDDLRVIAGQGTIGLEVLEQCPDVATIVIPLSGGGLAGGIAAAIKADRPDVRIVGVSQERGPAMIESIRAGHLVGVVETDTLADALAGGLGDVNRHTFALCRDLLDDTVVVSEVEIAAAMVALRREEGVVAEGGGAVGIAALDSGAVETVGSTVVVVSGGNVDPAVFARIDPGGAEAVTGQ